MTFTRSAHCVKWVYRVEPDGQQACIFNLIFLASVGWGCSNNNIATAIVIKTKYFFILHLLCGYGLKAYEDRTPEPLRF